MTTRTRKESSTLQISCFADSRHATAWANIATIFKCRTSSRYSAMHFAECDIHPILVVCCSCCHFNQVLFVVLCHIILFLIVVWCSAKSLHLTQKERLASQWVSKLISKLMPTELGNNFIEIWFIDQLKVVEGFSRHMAIVNGVVVVSTLMKIHAVLVKSLVLQIIFDPIEAFLDYISIFNRYTNELLTRGDRRTTFIDHFYMIINIGRLQPSFANLTVPRALLINLNYKIHLILTFN